MTRRERKAYNLGKKDGYDIGYAQGLYDGNPINILIDGISNFVDCFTEAINKHPELIEELHKQAKELEEASENEAEHQTTILQA